MTKEPITYMETLVDVARGMPRHFMDVASDTSRYLGMLKVL